MSAGGWGQISYYFTDKLYFNGIYGILENYAARLTETVPEPDQDNQQYIGNLFYDVNPAVRVAFEYTYIRTAFNQYGLNNSGNAALGQWPAYRLQWRL